MASKHAHHGIVEDSDVAFYRANGYLIHRHQLLPPAKFAGLQAFFERLLDELPQGKRPESMDVPHFRFPQLFEWLLAEEVLDFVEPFIGAGHRAVVEPFSVQAGG